MAPRRLRGLRHRPRLPRPPHPPRPPGRRGARPVGRAHAGPDAQSARRPRTARREPGRLRRRRRGHRLPGRGLALGYVWFALAGAAAASVGVHLLGSSGRKLATPDRLVVAGAAVTAVLYAFNWGVLLFDPEAFDQFRFWTVGSLAGRYQDVVLLILPFVATGLVVALLLAPSLNALAMGDQMGRALGVNVGRTRLLAALAVMLLCGAATAAAGPIGFVGLAVPHIARFVVGPDQRWVLTYSTLLAPVLLIGSDVLGRVLGAPGEVQVGIVTAFIGAPCSSRSAADGSWSCCERSRTRGEGPGAPRRRRPGRPRRPRRRLPARAGPHRRRHRPAARRPRARRRHHPRHRGLPAHRRRGPPRPHRQRHRGRRLRRQHPAPAPRPDRRVRRRGPRRERGDPPEPHPQLPRQPRHHRLHQRLPPSAPSSSSSSCTAA